MRNEKRAFFVYNNEYRDTVYALLTEKIETVGTGELTRRGDYTVGILSDRELIVYSFDVEKGLTKEEMDDTVEIRMFQDAGLNHTIDYKIVYGYRDSLLDRNHISVTVFAVAPTHFSASFAPFKNRCKHIDAILPFSTLPFGLYRADILEKRSDIFLYMGEKESTLSFYHDGALVYAKTLNMGLEEMHNLFLKSNDLALSFDAFTRIVVEKGVDATRYEDAPQEAIHPVDILSLFEKLLADANTVIGYAGRMAGIQRFDRLFFATERGTVPGIRGVIREGTGIEGEDFEFFTDFYRKGDPYVDQNVLLALIEAKSAAEGRETNPFNITLYPKPPRFIRRQSGRFITLTAAALVAALLYPAYLFFDARMQSYSYGATINRLQITQGAFLALKAQEDGIKAEKARYQQLLADEKKNLDREVALIKQIEAKKLTNHPKSEILSILFHQLNSHRIEIESLRVDREIYTLKLQAQKDDHLTSFLQAVTRIGNFSVAMQSFRFDPALNRYKTTIAITVVS